MTDSSHYTLKARPVGQFASTLEASWALHLRSMCDATEYTGATRESFDFLVSSGGRDLAVEIKPQMNHDSSAAKDANGIPDIVYRAARRAYRKQIEQVCRNGLVVTLIATGYPESANWFLVLSEADDRRYRHRHMRGSKHICNDINTRSYSDYTIYALDGAPEFGGNLTAWVSVAVSLCTRSVDVHDPQPLEDWAQRQISDKQRRKLARRARQALRCRQPEQQPTCHVNGGPAEQCSDESG